ncbi:Organic hydroperoxide resistance transcriptional regulator [Pseudovibrio axinellae]|uniref:Organic hydroperoxide resistance transcriptional regulator n=1 Tax=Pseudovibrio axinellae TaxID=989403 RepID=A0A165XTU2_9HYPH|nr:MarR family transcriptional regulator [Pseudovibrio axinellae]KZL18032.1 Organic hydroperoxide resistance transcriptional regulator [Pseudovibrio axinellae]SER12848.1 DNA-binding transcriptional regulator, MarR family [Pseudovibrio axinellae]
MTKKKPDEFQGYELDDHVCFAIYKANHAFNRFYKPVMKELGITYPQYITLLALFKKDHQRVSELGECLFLESNTLTPLLKRLEEMGYISRTRSQEDERQVIVSLSETGRGLSDGIIDIQQCAFSHLDTPAETIRQLVEQLNEVQAHMIKAKEKVSG